MGEFLDPRCTSSLTKRVTAAQWPATRDEATRHTQNASSLGKGKESPSWLFPSHRHPRSWHRPRRAGRGELASPAGEGPALRLRLHGLRGRNRAASGPELWGGRGGGRASRSQTFALYTSLEGFYLTQNLFSLAKTPTATPSGQPPSRLTSPRDPRLVLQPFGTGTPPGTLTHT